MKKNTKDNCENFEEMIGRFIKNYWQTWKLGTFRECITPFCACGDKKLFLRSRSLFILFYLLSLQSTICFHMLLMKFFSKNRTRMSKRESDWQSKRKTSTKKRTSRTVLPNHLNLNLPPKNMLITWWDTDVTIADGEECQTFVVVYKFCVRNYFLFWNKVIVVEQWFVHSFDVQGCTNIC